MKKIAFDDAGALLAPSFSDLDEIKAAASRIQPFINQTPLVEDSGLNDRLGCRVLMKCENMQKTASFKIRGALNQILSLKHKSNGLIAASSGNHAHAVAYMGMMMGLRVTVVVPDDLPAIKLENIKHYDARIVTYDREADCRDDIVSQLSQQQDLDIIYSSDHMTAIYGQGTVGLEVHGQMKKLGMTPASIIVNSCRGGLAAGVTLTRDLYTTPPLVHTAEPAGFNDIEKSLKTDMPHKNERRSGSICDALLAPNPGKFTFPILRDGNVTGLSADDTAVRQAMRMMHDYFDVMLEPSGAVALACIIENRTKFSGKTIVAIATGGNITAQDYQTMTTN